MELENAMFRKLWTIAIREGKKLGEKPGDVFSNLGLYLVQPVFENWGYLETPVNAVTFGSTGVDGEHFSFLSNENRLLNPSPIVMTVPMATKGHENIVVGKDLVDFLSLGYQVMFSALPALSYPGSEKDRLLNNLNNRNSSWEGEDQEDDWILTEIYLSKILEKELRLKPWDNVEKKLTYLKNQYYHLLKLQHLNRMEP